MAEYKLPLVPCCTSAALFHTCGTYIHVVPSSPQVSWCILRQQASLKHLLTISKHPVPRNFFRFSFNWPIPTKQLHKQHSFVPCFNTDNRHGMWCAQSSCMGLLLCYVHNHETVAWWKVICHGARNSFCTMFWSQESSVPHCNWRKSLGLKIFALFVSCAATTTCKLHWYNVNGCQNNSYVSTEPDSLPVLSVAMPD